MMQNTTIAYIHRTICKSGCHQITHISLLCWASVWDDHGSRIRFVQILCSIHVMSSKHKLPRGFEVVPGYSRVRCKMKRTGVRSLGKMLCTMADLSFLTTLTAGVHCVITSATSSSTSMYTPTFDRCRTNRRHCASTLGWVDKPTGACLLSHQIRLIRKNELEGSPRIDSCHCNAAEC